MRFLYVLSVLLLAVASACEILPTQTDQGYRDKIPIDTTLVITPWEVLSSDGPSLEFRVRTERIYGCFNYYITHRVKRRPSQAIEITFLSVAVPEICLTALGPATATIQIGQLASGEYPVPVVVNWNRIPARLLVTTEAYEVVDGTGPWTRFEPRMRRRVPEGAIWGLAGYARAEQAALVEAFEDSLRSLGARERSYAPGEYGYFEVGSGGTIETPASHGYYFARAFLFEYGGDLGALRDLVKRFAKAHPDWPSIRVFDWRGGAHYSWVLGRES